MNFASEPSEKKFNVKYSVFYINLYQNKMGVRSVAVLRRSFTRSIVFSLAYLAVILRTVLFLHLIGD